MRCVPRMLPVCESPLPSWLPPCLPDLVEDHRAFVDRVDDLRLQTEGHLAAFLGVVDPGLGLGAVGGAFIPDRAVLAKDPPSQPEDDDPEHPMGEQRLHNGVHHAILSFTRKRVNERGDLVSRPNFANRAIVWYGSVQDA